MKINDRMRYPHPVLSDFSSDYETGEFRCSFERSVSEAGELNITADLDLDSDPLLELIANKQAALGYFVVCRPTYFNLLQKAPVGKSEKFFQASDLFGTVQIRPVVWTLEEITGLSSDLISDEFGDDVPIAKGAVVAMGPEFRFSMDRKKFKPFDSIFELARDDTVDPGQFQVDHARERITISAESKTFNEIAGIRNMPVARDLLLGSVYVPSIMEVVSRLQADENMDSYKWYRIFSAKCDEMGIDPADTRHSPLDIAQRLMRNPVTRVIRVVEKL